jgi:hypothetical protein
LERLAESITGNSEVKVIEANRRGAWKINAETGGSPAKTISPPM